MLFSICYTIYCIYEQKILKIHINLYLYEYIFFNHKIVIVYLYLFNIYSRNLKNNDV